MRRVVVQPRGVEGAAWWSGAYTDWPAGGVGERGGTFQNYDEEECADEPNDLSHRGRTWASPGWQI